MKIKIQILFLVISRKASLATKVIDGLNSRRKLCYIFSSFGKLSEIRDVRFVTVNFDNSGTPFSQRVSFQSYKDKTFRNFFNFVKNYRKLLQTLGSEEFENNKRELPSNLSELVIRVGQAEYKVYDGQVNLYRIEVTKNDSSSKTVRTYFFRNGSVFWHNSVSFNYNSSCEKKFCNAGFYPVFQVHKCCWRCFARDYGYVKELPEQDPCTKCDSALSLPNKTRTKCIFFRYENYKTAFTKIKAVIIFTTLGIIYSSSYLRLIFFIFKNMPLVKSSNFQLSVFQLVLHLSLNMQFIVAVLEQAKLVCYIHITVWAYLLKGIISIYIIKINQLLMIFNSTALCHKTKFVTFKEVVTPCAYIVSNLFLTVYTQATRGEHAIYVDKKKIVKYRFCYQQTCLYIEIVTVVVLSVIAAAKAFVARKLPSNFSETRYIFLGMFATNILLLLMIPLDASLNVDGRVIFADALMVFFINNTALTVKYGYKIYNLIIL